MKNNLTSPPSVALFRPLAIRVAASPALWSLGIVPSNRALERVQQLVADQPMRAKRALEVEAQIAAHAMRRTKRR